MWSTTVFYKTARKFSLLSMFSSEIPEIVQVFAISYEFVNLVNNLKNRLKFVLKLQRYKQFTSPPAPLETCSICLGDILDGLQMRCKHVFHASCILAYELQAINSEVLCPMCRAAL